jgi:hypothetical protein
MSKEWKLGDTIDDYCSRCQLLMNHYVVSMVDTEVGKVRCQTCGNEHSYRRGKGGKKKSTEWICMSSYSCSLAATRPVETS